MIIKQNVMYHTRKTHVKFRRNKIEMAQWRPFLIGFTNYLRNTAKNGIIKSNVWCYTRTTQDTFCKYKIQNGRLQSFFSLSRRPCMIAIDLII